MFQTDASLRYLVSSGAGMAYQHPLIISNKISPSALYKREGSEINTFSNRQHNSFLIPSKNWGTKNQKLRDSHRRSWSRQSDSPVKWIQKQTWNHWRKETSLIGKWMPMFSKSFINFRGSQR